MRTTRHSNSLLYFSHKSITSLKKWYEVGELRKDGIPIAEDPELFPIDSHDPIFSNSKIDLILGKINKITLVKKEITDIKQSSYLYKALYLPKKICLILELKTEFKLIFSRGLDGHARGVDIIGKKEISPRLYEAFHYIPLDTFGTVAASSLAENVSQSSSFSESQTPSPEQEELQLPAQLWERIPIRVARDLRPTKVRVDCQADSFGLPSQVFIEVGEKITLKDLQAEHLLAARVMLSYAEIVQVVHENRKKLHDYRKYEECPELDINHLFGRLQAVLDNMCGNIRGEIPRLAFRSQLGRQELEDHLNHFSILTEGLELCRKLFIEISLDSTPDDSEHARSADE
jgi:hypothetical protein